MRIGMTLACAGVLASTLAMGPSARGAERLMIPAGSTGGTVYTWMATAAGILNKEQSRIEYSARSGGLVENVALLLSGELKIAATSGFDYYGWTKGKAPTDSDLRSVYIIAPLVCMLVLPREAPEKSLADLRGKTVQMGPRTSASYPIHKMIMEALDLKEADFTTFALSAGAGADAFAEGKVYVNMFLTGLPRPPALERMMQGSRGIKLVFYSEKELERIVAKYPVIKPLEVSSSELPGIDQPVRMPAVWPELVVHKGFAEEDAYQIAKILDQQYETLTKAFPTAVYSTLKNTATQSAFPLHPGVQRYMREKGLLKP